MRTEKTGGGRAQTAVALTGEGRAALERYIAVLRQLPRQARDDHQAPAPHERVGDADRDTAAAALGEHFAQGRLTLDELNARLDATLTARTHGELAQAARDLPARAPARGVGVSRDLVSDLLHPPGFVADARVRGQYSFLMVK